MKLIAISKIFAKEYFLTLVTEKKELYNLNYSNSYDLQDVSWGIYEN